MPAPINQARSPGSERGQALVELLLAIIVCSILAVGIYETGALFHNVSIMNQAISSATHYAAQGADVQTIEEAVVDEAENLFSGAFLRQNIASDTGLVIKVKNPETDQQLGEDDDGGHTFRPQCTESLPPEEPRVSPYLFWAQGYEIQLGIRYRIGIYIPFLQALSVDMVLSDSKRITAQNDLDRDGLVDDREAEYVDWAMEEKANVTGLLSDTTWTHPVHRDETATLDTSGDDIDIDGDGDTLAADTQPYDRDNDGIEDQYDKAERSDRVNLLTMNPLVGPGVRPNLNDDKWMGGDCPY